MKRVKVGRDSMEEKIGRDKEEGKRNEKRRWKVEGTEKKIGQTTEVAKVSWRFNSANNVTFHILLTPP